MVTYFIKIAETQKQDVILKDKEQVDKIDDLVNLKNRREDI